MNDGRTHWEGCHADRAHHACALERIRRLEAELARLKPARPDVPKLTLADQVRHMPGYQD